MGHRKIILVYTISFLISLIFVSAAAYAVKNIANFLIGVLIK